MSDLTCQKCGKTFKKLCWLKRHSKRKTSCATIIRTKEIPLKEQVKPFHCKFCNRGFTNQHHMRRHIRKTCIIGNLDPLMIEHVKQQQEQNILLQERLEKMETQVSQLVTLLTTREEQHNTSMTTQNGSNKTIATQGDNNTTTQNNIKQNVTINIFGQETVDHIDYLTVYKLLNEIQPRFEVQEAAKALLSEILLKIYGSADHPENRTCYLPNKKTSDTIVHGPGGWENRSSLRTCQPMIQKGLDVLFKFGNQPLSDKPGCENMKPPDKFEDIYKALVAKESEYPGEMKNEIRAILLQIRTLLQKEQDNLPKAGDE